jgi:type IV pilus assembly protein PilM
MFDWFSKSKVQPIGLDIGHSSIKMIQLYRDEETARVAAAGNVDIDPILQQDPSACREFIVSSIRQMYRRNGFRGRQVVSCLSSDMIRIKSLRLDTVDPQDIEQFMREEVAVRLGLNPDIDELRYMVAGSVFQGEQMKNEVIFFGIEHAVLSNYIEMLEQAQLEPVAVDTVPCALFRSFQRSLRRKEDMDMASVLVNLGDCFTTVVIGRGQRIIFIKQIPIAGEQLTAEIAARLGVKPAEAARLRSKLRDPQGSGLDEETARAVTDAMSGMIESLAREISLCFKYYAVTFRGQCPSEAIFAGGEACETVLMDALRRQLGVQIRIAEPLRGFDLSGVEFDRRFNPQMCEWAVAVGLGLKGWDMIEKTPDILNPDALNSVQETV